jgi:hypothetical protein
MLEVMIEALLEEGGSLQILGGGMWGDTPI